MFIIYVFVESHWQMWKQSRYLLIKWELVQPIYFEFSFSQIIALITFDKKVFYIEWTNIIQKNGDYAH